MNVPGKHWRSRRADITLGSVPPGEEPDADEAVSRVLRGCNYPAGTSVVAGGCYAFVVDGLSFSEMIVFKAVANW